MKTKGIIACNGMRIPVEVEVSNDTTFNLERVIIHVPKGTIIHRPQDMIFIKDDLPEAKSNNHTKIFPKK